MAKEAVQIEFKGFLSFLILHELSQKELSGEDLAVRIGKRKGSQLTPGTIYPTMKKLRKFHMVKFKRYGRRKVYFLTEEGKQELERLYAVITTYFDGLFPYLKPKKAKKKSTKKKGKIKKA
ncbi:MAG: PadR family transcriptional regulator [Nanoarchaeota archaeon]|nr:PadR family transcriptional regulator [Nanoarchaeota archaeon]